MKCGNMPSTLQTLLLAVRLWSCVSVVDTPYDGKSWW